jgi:hypothetical protein
MDMSVAIKLTFQPIQVDTGSADEDGQLVLANGKLVAILVRLSDEHEQAEFRGAWFVEASFGSWTGCAGKMFSTLEDAEAWIVQRLDANLSPAKTRFKNLSKREF